MINYFKKLYNRLKFKIYVKLFAFQIYFLNYFNEYDKFEPDQSYYDMLRKKK